MNFKTIDLLKTRDECLNNILAVKEELKTTNDEKRISEINVIAQENQKSLDTVQVILKTITYPLVNSIDIILEALKRKEKTEYEFIMTSEYYEYIKELKKFNRKTVFFLKKKGTVVPSSETTNERNIHLRELKETPGIIILYLADYSRENDLRNYPNNIAFQKETNTNCFYLAECLPDNYKYLEYEVAKYTL